MSEKAITHFAEYWEGVILNANWETAIERLSMNSPFAAYWFTNAWRSGQSTLAELDEYLEEG